MAANFCLPEALLTRLRPLLQQAAPRSEIWAFGSRVNSDAHPGSDLDLALRRVPAGESPSRIAARLRSVLADSDLPIAVDVLDWSTLPDPMRAQIEKNHVVLQTPPAS